MSKHLIIHDEIGVRKLTIPTGVSRLGSGAGCELQLNHEELQPHALTLDLRGETLLVHNHNPFSVYLGNDELQAGQMAAWHENTTLNLTRSITLALEGDQPVVMARLPEEDETERKSGISQRQLFQLSVIALCGIIAYWQLNKAPNASIKNQVKDFGDIMQLVTGKIEATASPNTISENSQWRDVKRLLQEAYFLEIHPGQYNLTAAVEAYQRILETDLIRNAKLQDDQQIESEIFRFSTAKKFLLSDR